MLWSRADRMIAASLTDLIVNPPLDAKITFVVAGSALAVISPERCFMNAIACDGDSVSTKTTYVNSGDGLTLTAEPSSVVFETEIAISRFVVNTEYAISGCASSTIQPTNASIALMQ